MRLFFVTVLVAGCASSRASPPAVTPTPDPPPAESRPAEAPPAPGQRANVSVTLSGKRFVADQVLSWHVEGTYTTFEEEVDGGRRHVVEGFSGWSGEVPDRLVDGPGFLAPLFSPIVLEDDGEFERLEGPAAVRTAIREMVERSGFARRTTPEIMANLLTDRGLNALAKEVWATHRTFVHEVGLGVGQRREIPTRAAVPHLGGTFLDMRVVVSRDRDQPCPGDEARACAVFSMRIVPDGEQIRRVIEDLPLGDGPRLTGFDQETNTTLVCDERSHAPYVFRMERRSEVRSDGGVRAEERSTREYRYTYRSVSP